MYVKLKKKRLNYYRLKQDDIRNKFLQGIVDPMTAGETKVRCRIILPPNFVGNPMNMRREYIDAMTLLKKFGNQIFSITMTCNPSY